MYLSQYHDTQNNAYDKQKNEKTHFLKYTYNSYACLYVVQNYEKLNV